MRTVLQRLERWNRKNVLFAHEAEHAAEAVHLPAGCRVPGTGRRTRVEDAFDGRVGFR